MNRNGHSHDHADKFCGCCHLSNRTRLSCMLVMTFSFFLVELIVGQMTKSITLITDSFHMLSDSLALIVGLFSVIIAARKTNKNTFGWVRAEILGGLINSVFLVSVCLGMFVEAIERFFEPKQIEDPKLMLIVGSIGLGINLVGLFIFGHAHSHTSIHEQDNNNHADGSNVNMRAIFLHILTDFLGSVIVILSSLLHMYQNEINIPGSLIDFLEPVLCTIIAFLILFHVKNMLIDSALILLEAVPDEINIQDLRDDIVKRVPNSEILELHVWQLTNKEIIATLNLRCMNRDINNNAVADLKNLLINQYGINSSTIQLE
ncbi:unnamed protein product [Brachionus calyciflorus]|uniref:Cation efflux protein transmembrane domain-containing protein n=1 Tax=Brachionus calyciflorus TaxID=104777 RepID=A0A813MAE9_9BILA|nr:unnamed protein product [Brachionus calyciflorus]